MQSQIKLNDLLGIDDLMSCKVRFVTSFGKEANPLDLYRAGEIRELNNWLFWNYKKKSYKLGQIVVGLVRIDSRRWLLFNVSKITRDLDVKDGPGYEFEVDESRQKYCGRVIVSFHNKVQNLIRNASTVLHKCYVAEVLESAYKDDEFPGYDEVDLAWQDLARVIDNKVWKSALENQKGVYLISDQSNGKQYVGSAYGEQMLHGRWSRYVNNYHGGNVELMTLDDNHIRTQFRYSILETYRSTTADDLILRRENWWKRVLQTREFGYNKN